MRLRPHSHLLDHVVVFWLVVVGLVMQQSATGFTTIHTSSARRDDLSVLLATASSTTLDGRKIKGEIQPLNNFVLVKTADAIESTEGGILLTGKAKLVKTQGTVVALGPGRTHPDSGLVFEMPVAKGELHWNR